MVPDERKVVWIDTALDDLRDFPKDARHDAGFQLEQVQLGLEPDDWKPMPSIGAGCREIRAPTADGAFRVFYVTKFSDAVFVLHCFTKKSQRTAQRDIAIGNQRYTEARKQYEKERRARELSVWDDIADDAAEAENLKLRAALIRAIRSRVDEIGWSQTAAAQNLGITQPRLSDVYRGKISKFSLDALVEIASKLGIHVRIEVEPDFAVPNGM